MEDVTAILAAPREFARRYENLEAQLEVRDSTIATLEKALAAVTAERDAARADIVHIAEQWHDAEKRADAARAAKTAREVLNIKTESGSFLLRPESVEIESRLAVLINAKDGEITALSAEVARLTAALGAIEFIDYGNGLVLCPRCGFRKIMGHGAGCSLNAALRGDTAPAKYPIDDEPCENCVHGRKWHWDDGKCQNACPCEKYAAPAQPAGTKVVSLNSLNKCDKCGHLMVDHDRTDDGRRICMRLGCDCIDTAPATGRE